MIKMETVFFGENGLTSTSARYIVDLAYGLIRDINQDLTQIKLVNEDVSVLDCEVKTRVSVGWNAEELSQLESKLDRITRIRVLIAWLEKALMEKEKVASRVKSEMTDEDICKELDIEMPESPRREKPLEEVDYIASLPENERSVIEALKSKVSYLRRYIEHDRGPFAKACEEMHEALKKPAHLAGSERRRRSSNNDALLVHYFEPSVDEKLVEEVFFRLMKKYRETHAELNKHMHRVTSEVEKENLRRLNDYKEACRRYNNLSDEMHAMIDIWREENLRRINDLRIVIPKGMREIYDEVHALGKG